MLLLHILYPRGRSDIGSDNVVNSPVYTKYIAYSAQVLLIYLQHQTELCSKVAHGLNILLILCMPVPVFLPMVNVLHLPRLISAYQDRQLQNIKDSVSLSARTEMCCPILEIIGNLSDRVDATEVGFMGVAGAVLVNKGFSLPVIVDN